MGRKLDTKNMVFLHFFSCCLCKSSVYSARHSSSYLLLYSECLGKIVDVIHKEGGRI